MFASVGNGFAYDAFNRLTVVHSLDAQGRITKVTLPQSNATAIHPEHSYRYDLMGNLVAKTDAKGQTTEYVYDALNRRIETRLANGQAEHFAYDSVGNLTAHTLLSGEVITYRYDNRNRLKTRTLPDNSVTRWTYTKTGQIASVSDDVGTISYSYDVMDRVERVQKSDGQTIDYGYDANGNLTKIQTANTTTTYGYDALNRMSTVTTVGVGSIDTTSYAYDLVGNVVTVNHGNGTQTSKRYDDLNRVTSIISKNGATVISSQTYTYTLDNQVASITFDDGSVETFSYDGLNRLVKEVRTGTNPHSIDYTYDAVGNRTQKTESGAVSSYQYDNVNRLISVTGAENYRFAYDANGNRTAVSGDDNRVYSWNTLMQLVGAQGDDKTTFNYDALGHQIGKTTSGKSTNYLVDAQNPTGYRQVIESQSNGMLSQNIFGNDLIVTNTPNSKSYYHADKLGTVRATSNASGNLIASMGYGSAYGQSTLNKDHYGFTGERFDSNANALYLRARYYDPKVGAFLSRDRFSGFLKKPLSRNRYLYTHGNPVNGIDPSGHVNSIELNLNSTLMKTLRVQSRQNFQKQLRKKGFDISKQMGKKAEDFVEKIVKECIKPKSIKKHVRIEDKGSRRQIDLIVDAEDVIRNIEVKSSIPSLGSEGLRRLKEQLLAAQRKGSNINGDVLLVGGEKVSNKRLEEALKYLGKQGVDMNLIQVFNGFTAFAQWAGEMYFEECIEF